MLRLSAHAYTSLSTLLASRGILGPDESPVIGNPGRGQIVDDDAPEHNPPIRFTNRCPPRETSGLGAGQPDVDAAAEHFEEAEIFTPYAAMCQTLGCRSADFLRSLREAADRESAKYGRPIPSDDQYLVMHRMPPRGGDDGHDAIISFTLCDDIRERLERGEDV